MEELQEFLRLLKCEYYEEAAKVLDKVINTKRDAYFEEDDSAKEMFVKDKVKEEETNGETAGD